MVHISTVHVEELLLVVFGAPGFLLLGWAIVARQFRGSANGNFGFVEPGEPLPRPATGVSKLKRRLTYTLIVAVFLLLSVCPVVLTLVMVYRGVNALKSEHAASRAVLRNH